ncbi:hypothetical protein OG462_32320 [Streptomyces sp. NBC_01077]|nr:hypothetical protein OG462_32320 [Streptomyces sp. NBC_01077]
MSVTVPEQFPSPQHSIGAKRLQPFREGGTAVAVGLLEEGDQLPFASGRDLLGGERRAHEIRRAIELGLAEFVHMKGHHGRRDDPDACYVPGDVGQPLQLRITRHQHLQTRAGCLGHVPQSGT